jgi:hypothetical protein
MTATANHEDHEDLEVADAAKLWRRSDLKERRKDVFGGLCDLGDLGPGPGG